MQDFQYISGWIFNEDIFNARFKKTLQKSWMKDQKFQQLCLFSWNLGHS